MKKILASALALFACITLTGCGNSGGSAGNEDTKKIVVGATSSPHAIILNKAKDLLKDKGYTLEIKEFSDYPQINPSTSDGSLDANFFQHKPYLDGYNADNKLSSGDDGYLVSIGAIHFEPLGIYAEDTQGKTVISAEDVEDGDKIAVPNDATNEARALLLLEKYGIIKLKEGAGINATVKDIESKVKDIELYELDAAKVPTSLKDVKYAVINGNYALDAKLIGNEDETKNKFICGEEKEDEAALTYANIIAIKEANKDSEAAKALVEVLKSEELKSFIETEFKGTVIPAK